MASKRVSMWRRGVGILVALGCIAYAASALAGWAVLRYAGERWWPATFLLFSPRWIWGMPVLVLLPISLVFCRRGALLVAASGFFVLFGQMSFRVPWRLAIPAGRVAQRVRVVTANLHNRQVNPMVLDTFIAQTQPDVVALQDYISRVHLGFLRQPGWHVWSGHGLLVASRWPVQYQQGMATVDTPFSPLEKKWWVPGDSAAACVQIHAATGAFRLVDLHLTSPHRPLEVMREDRRDGIELLAGNSVRREQESRAIRQMVKGSSGPVILVGDFNTPDDSPIFRANWSDFRDAFNAAGFGFGTTYAKHHTWLRIDHILYGGEWTCRGCYASGDIGSGHRAVFAELAR